MSTIKLVGRTTDFRGKTLWEIVGNLRNHGIGRYVQRNMFLRYPEPCYMKIVRVEALPAPAEGDRKVKVWVEKTFRGRTLEKPVEICSTSYKADYLLVPKEQEATVCRPLGEPIAERILPQTVDMPPLLREFVERETGQRNPQLPIIIKPNREKIARLARDGETPNVSVSMDLGKPISPRLYKGLDV